MLQSTRPVRGATSCKATPASSRLFQSTRPVRGATNQPFSFVSYFGFQSTRPMRGATWRHDGNRGAVQCFNPRAPCGARRFWRRRPHSRQRFQSTRPVRGATTGSISAMTMAMFQSTRPVRGATGHTLSGITFAWVSIHAPRAGRDSRSRSRRAFSDGFNPRAPCGARHRRGKTIWMVFMFQSTRPMRARHRRMPMP